MGEITVRALVLLLLVFVLAGLVACAGCGGGTSGDVIHYGYQGSLPGKCGYCE